MNYITIQPQPVGSDTTFLSFLSLTSPATKKDLRIIKLTKNTHNIRNTNPKSLVSDVAVNTEIGRQSGRE
jgi:hypothetical protein